MKRISSILSALLISAATFAQGMFPPPEASQTPPAVPAYVTFCGDTIRFDSDEKYERMDRELMSFCYMHTTSSLMLKRAGRYFPQIEPILQDEGVPEDFKYLCVIESNLDPKAVSVTGASGLWQFTKATARDYGLEVSSEVDERYNTEKATRAACKYIRKAYATFGDWAAVAACYNCGPGGVSKRMETQNQTDPFELWLPEETARYVYRILAAKMMFQNPEAFGFKIYSTYPYRPVRMTVTVSGSIPSLADFAAQYGVTYAELKRANLWLRDDHLTNKDKKTYVISIP